MSERANGRNCKGVNPAGSDRPVLVWDGDCGFCRRAVEWLRTRAPDEVHFVPYQQISGDVDAVGRSEFEASVFLFRPSGEWSRGAEAIFD